MEHDIYLSYMTVIVRSIASSLVAHKKIQSSRHKYRRSRRYKGRGKWQSSVLWTSYQEQLVLLRADASAEASFENLPANYQALGVSGAVQFLKDAKDAQDCFRLRYRVSHAQFEKLMVLVRGNLGFNESLDCTGKKGTVAPLELKVMCVLRILGRDSVQDDLAQMSGIGLSTLNTFFRTFCAKFSVLYNSFIDILGTSAAVPDTYEHLPGCLGSVDGVHLWWDRVPFHLRNQYKGQKSYPSVSFGVTANHTGRILSVTKGFQGSKNDKTVVRYDGFIKKLKENPYFTSSTFELLNSQGNPVIHRGMYVICDNGYHNWRALQSPISLASGFWDRNYSRFIESQRKDIECVFGRLKARFLILKHPIRVLKHETVENIFFTCCILHNFIIANGEAEKEVQWLENESSRFVAEEFRVAKESLNINKKLPVHDSALPRPQIVLSFEKNEGETEQESDFFQLRTSLRNHFRYLVKAKILKWATNGPGSYRHEIEGTD